MVALGETLEEAFHYIFNVQLACETQVRENIFVFSLAKGVTQDSSVSSPFITAECCVKGRNCSL